MGCRVNKRFLVAAGIVLLVVVIFVAGFFFWNFMDPKSITRAEKKEVTALVEGFGSKLKEVSLSDPEEVVSQKIKDVYAPFVSSRLLINLTDDPARAPGRSVSSPRPEKIAITSMEKPDDHTVKVTGNILFMTSRGDAGKTPIVLWAKNTGKGGVWLIDSLSYGAYASYDMEELTTTLKRAFPNVGSIGERGEPFIEQTIDLNGDSVPEAVVDLQTGGAYTEDYTICQLEDGKLRVADVMDKNMPLSLPKVFSSGASVQHEVKLQFMDDGTGKRVIYQYTIDKSPSDPAVTEKITVEAYKWNKTTKEFAYDEGLSTAFEQEEEKLLMPRVLAFSSLNFKQITSKFSAIDAVAAYKGKVIFSAGSGKSILNDFGSANINDILTYDAVGGKLEGSTSVSKISRKWARILDVQANDRWMLFSVLEDPGEMPSECFAISRSTNKLIKLLPGYNWGEKVSPDTTVFTVFERTLLQGDYAYLVIQSEDMVVSDHSVTFRSGAGGKRFVRVNLKDGKQEVIFTPPQQSFSISQLWALDNDSVAFGTSEVLASGDIRDSVYFYDPSSATLETVIVDQWKDLSDPRYIDTYTITPDRKIVYAYNKRIVIAPVTAPDDFTDVGIAENNDYISSYIVASDDYLVARLDDGDIFVLNRKSGDRTLIKGANVRNAIALNTDEIAFVNRQEKVNDSVVHLDLKALSRSRLVITDSTGNISAVTKLPTGVSGKELYVYLQNKILQPGFGGTMFCAYSFFGSEIKGNKMYIYLWTLLQEYRSENRQLVAGVGMSCPIALVAVRSQQGYTITGYWIPENGTAYAPSIRKMFPRAYYNEIFSRTQLFDTVIGRKQLDNVKRQAGKYFDLQ